MISLKSFVRLYLGFTGIVILILAALFVYFTRQYVGNEAIEAGLQGYSWIIKVVVYGASAFLFILGGLEILSAASQNRCLICLVSVFIILVWYICHNNLHILHSSVSCTMGQ